MPCCVVLPDSHTHTHSTEIGLPQNYQENGLLRIFPALYEIWAWKSYQICFPVPLTMITLFWTEPHHLEKKGHIIWEEKRTQKWQSSLKSRVDVLYDSRLLNWWVTVVHSSFALCAHYREAIGIDWCSGQHFWRAGWGDPSGHGSSILDELWPCGTLFQSERESVSIEGCSIAWWYVHKRSKWLVSLSDPV